MKNLNIFVCPVVQFIGNVQFKLLLASVGQTQMDKSDMGQ